MLDKIILFCVLGLLALLIIVVLIRTLLFKPKKEESKKIEKVDFDQDACVNSLRELVMCKTISYYDKTKEDQDEFNKLKNKLRDLFPNVFNTSEEIKLNDKCILLRWKGKSNLKPTVLMAHFDVVPVDETMWKHDPFGGEIIDDVLWGRGTLDTKGTLNGAMSACEELIKKGFVPENDIYLAFAGDEEIAGIGAPTIVKYFKDNNIKPNMVIDEGGAVVENVFPGVKEECALVGIAEKGLLSVSMEIESNGGHASAPKARTSIGKLSEASYKLETHPFKAKFGLPALKMFDTLGRHSTFVYRMIFANLWLFKGVLNNICKKGGGELNALVRTTFALTQMEGSNAINVLPTKAKMCANLRLISGDTVESAVSYINKTINNKEIKVNALDGTNPSTISSVTSEEWFKVKNAISNTWEGALVSPYIMIQCSDSRHYSGLCDNIYRFSAMHFSKEERSTIHGNNECVTLKEIRHAVEFYINLIKQC